MRATTRTTTAAAADLNAEVQQQRRQMLSLAEVGASQISHQESVPPLLATLLHTYRKSFSSV